VPHAIVLAGGSIQAIQGVIITGAQAAPAFERCRPSQRT
jgi:hypothetical protein